MTRMICAVGLLLACVAGADNEVRAWTSKTGGSAIEASFVKEENGVVTLKRKDGVTVQAKLDALCETDRAYVAEVTYVPREIKVVFKRERLGPGYVESGSSEEVTHRDSAVLVVDAAAGDAPADLKGDTTWAIESVDALGKKILPRREGVGEALTTDGKFVFVTYRVKNDSRVPVEIPSPTLHDRQGRAFTQTERGFAQHFIPEGALFAGVDLLQPGFSKLYCAFYELPEDAEPAAVEVFPSVVKMFMIRQIRRGGEPLRGKKIALAPSAPLHAAAPSSGEGSVAADAKLPLFMRCTRVGQSGDSSGQWYYDRNKKRSLTYGVELRVLGDEARPVTLKAFYIGEASGNRDLVVDKKEQAVTLEPGKIARVTLQSEEIEEQTYFYFSQRGRERISGAKLKGVIIQAWAGGTLVSSWTSLSQWRKYADLPDIVKELGEMKKGEEGL